MDVHVPIAITEGLRRRGIDVLTSQEDGTREVDDESLLARARELDRVLFSQDQDLLRIANTWQSSGRPFAGFVFAQQRQINIGLCIEDLELLAQCCTSSEITDCVYFLPLT